MPKRADSNRTAEAKLKAIHLRNTRQAKYAKTPLKVSK
jgi:hypothetical protein